jgi:hypothetical protein
MEEQKKEKKVVPIAEYRSFYAWKASPRYRELCLEKARGNLKKSYLYGQLLKSHMDTFLNNF